MNVNRQNSFDLVTPVSHNQSKSIVYPLNQLKGRGVESLFEDMKHEIRNRCYPKSIRTPFVAKEVFLLSDSQTFVLLSTHGKACFLSMTDPDPVSAPVIDLSNMVKNEVRTMALFNDEQVYFGDIYGSLNLINLKNLSDNYIGQVGNLRSLIFVTDTLYLLDERLTSLCGEKVVGYRNFWDDATVALAVKEDQSILAISTKALKVYVYDIKQKESIINLSTEKECGSIKISQNYLVAACDGDIKIWSLANWNLLSTRHGNTQKYTSIDINKSETYIAAGCKDGSVHIWSVEDPLLLPLKFSGYSESIEKIKFMNEVDLYYFSSEQSRIMTLTIKGLNREFEAEIPPNPVNEIIEVKNSNSLLVRLQDNGILILDSENLKTKTHILASKDVILSVNEPEKSLNVCRNRPTDKHIESILYDLTTFRLMDSEVFVEQDNLWWVNAQANRPNYAHYLLCFANGILSIMGTALTIVRDCKIHENQITAVLCSNSGEFSISGDDTGTILMYDLSKFAYNGKFRKHNGKITSLCISADDSILISGSIDGMVRVSDISSRTCINTIKHHQGEITKIYITNNNQNFMISSRDRQFTIWNMHSKTLITCKDGIDCFLVSLNEDFLFLAGDGKLLRLYNPLNNPVLAVFGHSTDGGAFYKYLYKILKNQYPAYNSEFNNWIITPYMMNPLHFYAYANLSKHMKQALNDDICFIEDIEKNTPLSISVRNKSLLMNDILEFIVHKLEKSRGFAHFLENSLVDVTGLGSEHLNELYNKLFVKLQYSQLPEFCDQSVKLPIYIHTENTYNIKLEEFFDSKQINLGKAIEFKQFPIKICYELGSQETINLFEKLVQCPNTDIFRTDYIHSLLEQKWTVAKWIITFQGMAYFTYLILLVSYISFELNQSILFALFIMSTVVMSYEILQMLGMKFQYFTDPLNILDLFRGIVFYIHSFIVFLEQDDYDATLIFLVIVSFIRGITYFSIFGPTRYMTYLIKEVFIDMLSFFILLSYSIIAVSGVFTAIDHEQDRGTLLYYLEVSYNMSLGNFETDEFSVGERVIFVFASVINMIIMLNLLISILGDTFDKVQQGLTEADRKAIAEMVLEVEYLMFWRRHRHKKTYFSSCMESKIKESQSKTWEGKIRVLINKIENTRQAVLRQNNQLPKEIEKIIRNEVKKDLTEIKQALKKQDASNEMLQGQASRDMLSQRNSGDF